jgi:hypothetical protein
LLLGRVVLKFVVFDVDVDVSKVVELEWAAML